tara:strand:- start:797 stop:1267 length:471 start_codon:yes stop_codon:yes gene_type:complete
MLLKSNTLDYSFYCDPNFKKPSEPIIQSFCDEIFQSNKITKVKVLFIFCSDDYLSNLKKEFFNKNQYTDVITFRMNEDLSELLEGEVYISLDRALENSDIYKQPYEKEVIRLVIHGCLHLIGFDDQSSKEKEHMTKMEEYFLRTDHWKNLFKTFNE